jgi:hypothetical protein
MRLKTLFWAKYANKTIDHGRDRDHTRFYTFADVDSHLQPSSTTRCFEQLRTVSHVYIPLFSLIFDADNNRTPENRTLVGTVANHVIAKFSRSTTCYVSFLRWQVCGPHAKSTSGLHESCGPPCRLVRKFFLVKRFPYRPPLQSVTSGSRSG